MQLLRDYSFFTWKPHSSQDISPSFKQIQWPNFCFLQRPHSVKLPSSQLQLFHWCNTVLGWYANQTCIFGSCHISAKLKMMYDVLSLLWNLSFLIYLDISGNSIGGLLPGCMGNFTSLEVLRLSDNMEAFLTCSSAKSIYEQLISGKTNFRIKLQDL